MKAKLLRAQVELLARHAEDFDMGVGLVRKPWSLKSWWKGKCGTVCCIAGQTFLSVRPNALGWLKKDTRLSGLQADWPTVQGYAAAALELSAAEAARLFYLKNWPEEFSSKYILAQTGAGRISALRDAVENFIQTNGWEPEVKVAIKDGELIESTS